MARHNFKLPANVIYLIFILLINRKKGACCSCCRWTDYKNVTIYLVLSCSKIPQNTADRNTQYVDVSVLLCWFCMWLTALSSRAIIIYLLISLHFILFFYMCLSVPLSCYKNTVNHGFFWAYCLKKSLIIRWNYLLLGPYRL